MDLKVEFDEAAFRHGVVKEDIVAALRNHLADGLVLAEDDNDYAAVGFDRAGNLLEVIYEDLGGDAVRVYHAMKCRKKFYDRLTGQERARKRPGD
jgi:hypothetical protein